MITFPHLGPLAGIPVEAFSNQDAPNLRFGQSLTGAVVHVCCLEDEDDGMIWSRSREVRRLRRRSEEPHEQT